MWRRGLLFKPVSHVGLVILTLLVVVFGGLFNGSRISAQDLSDQEAVLLVSTSSETIVPADRPRAEVLEYKVASGDTLSKIADSFNVSVETIKWANNLSGDDLDIDQTLKIPPVTGMLHTVKDGETIEGIAKKYKADAQTIIDFPFNYIDDSMKIKIGQVLVVPNGVKPEAPRPVVPTPPAYMAKETTPLVRGGGSLRWPVSGIITQYSSWWHPGALDIANSIGTPVVAAENGVVIASIKEWGGYGWHVIVDHGNGITTLYAHFSAIYVNVGQSVGKGQVIGAVGSTGRSTGPHLHFEVRKNGAHVDPVGYLQ